ncbi:hypothetical protein BY458DRAFT_570738 [Sporodiniella umbellata]|nr:hypothetical protein BY458DRAFT_570738 [Sporodiniella umbellata]
MDSIHNYSNWYNPSTAALSENPTSLENSDPLLIISKRIDIKKDVDLQLHLKKPQDKERISVEWLLHPMRH